MDLLNAYKESHIKAETGKLLIAEPYLADPAFARTVVFLCGHGPDGAIGFILNRLSENTVDLLLPEAGLPALPVYVGGPVQADTLHMLHRIPERLGGTEIIPGVFWGGSYEALAGLRREPAGGEEQVRLFTGYAGWGEGQLEEELKRQSWIVAHTRQELIFETAPKDIWAGALQSLGADFTYLTRLPPHPQLN